MGVPLPPGWYALKGRLEAIEGEFVLPSVCFHYVRRSALTEVECLLPDRDASGRFDMLVMFFEEVESLEFLPGTDPVRFRLTEFALQRVSRLTALRTMLAGPTGAQRKGRAGRALKWGRTLTTRGMKRATDELLTDYRNRSRPAGISEYEAWTRKYNSFSPTALDSFTTRAHALADRGPPILLLMPVADVSGRLLRGCLDSVLAQAWQRWELRAVVSVHMAPDVAAVVAEYAARDPRIDIVQLDRGGDEASVLGLSAAPGAFVALMEPDAELRPHALLRIVEHAVADPDLAFIYSDEDKIDLDGRRRDPDFKPDWNPDLLCSRDYLGHLTAISALLVQEVDGFHGRIEVSAGHDLALRCSERLAPHRICHIPEVLYHGRAVPADGAADRAATAARAVAAHLERVGSGATAEVSDAARGFVRVRWKLPSPAPKISLIIPTRDRLRVLRMCVESVLRNSTYPDFELVVVDNQSSERAALDYLRELATRERVRVLHFDAPFNYSSINNWAARQCTGQLLGLVNNDIEVITPGWMEEMAGFAVRADVGAVGAMLYYPGDTIQHAGMVLGLHGVAGHVFAGMPRGSAGYAGRARVAQNVSAVTGACMLVRRDLFDAVGGLDERLPIEFNDVDFCLRLRERGYRNVWTPFAEMCHHESASRAIDDPLARRARNAGVALMLERWGDALRDDPAYNPNLSLESLDCGLAFPPRSRAPSTPTDPVRGRGGRRPSA